MQSVAGNRLGYYIFRVGERNCEFSLEKDIGDTRRHSKSSNRAEKIGLELFKQLKRDAIKGEKAETTWTYEKIVLPRPCNTNRSAQCISSCST